MWRFQSSWRRYQTSSLLFPVRNISFFFHILQTFSSTRTLALFRDPGLLTHTKTHSHWRASNSRRVDRRKRNHERMREAGRRRRRRSARLARLHVFILGQRRHRDHHRDIDGRLVLLTHHMRGRLRQQDQEKTSVAAASLGRCEADRDPVAQLKGRCIPHQSPSRGSQLAGLREAGLLGREGGFWQHRR